MKLKAKLVDAQQANTWLNTAYKKIKPYLFDGHTYSVTIEPETRSTAANRCMWAALNDLSSQVIWHGKNLSPEDWKNIMSASLKRQRTERGIDGEWVVMGQSTREYTKQEMNDMLELIFAFGAQHNVKFSTPERNA